MYIAETAPPLDEAATGKNTKRLPWAKPVLVVYETDRLTQDGGNANGDGLGDSFTES